MALITSKTLLTSISLFHVTLAFFFLTNPNTINDQILVQVLGQSMGVPHSRGFDTHSQPLAFLAFVLAGCGLSDLVSLGMPEELGSLYYWGTQAPFRSLLSMLLAGYIYLFGPSSPLYGGHTRGYNPAYSASGWGGDALKNRVMFTFAFFEMIVWFWVWVTLREERAEVVERLRRNDKRD